ncbi:MAG: ATP-dependent Clp protease proteolytic subunit [Rhodococcus sp. (in: high G+C Gram-positive bacteria)]|uniref:ATP-dependent Clp protease proteolytic subunit n=1 Tax=Rhodococcus sp. TaxID=1831 RepID=UPI003BAEBD40
MNIWPPPSPPPFPPFHTPWEPEPRPATPRPTAPTQYVIAGRPDWLAERLFDQRIISLTGRVGPDDVNRAVTSLALLDASGDDPVQLWLCDVDADLDSVLTLLDALGSMRVPIHVRCLGTITGIAIALLAPADQRTGTPHATFRLREPRTTSSGRPSDVTSEAERHRQQLRTLQRRIADACHRPIEDVTADMHAQRILSAPQALEYGLLDTITSERMPERD